MKKKIIIGVIALVVIVLVFLVYANYRNRSLSPRGNTELTVNGLTVSIPYSRPSVKGRLIFGTAEQKALLPYGKYWRLGANEATEITVNKPGSTTKRNWRRWCGYSVISATTLRIS